MNRKTETILAWIANGLSIIYLLLTCLSLCNEKWSKSTTI